MEVVNLREQRLFLFFSISLFLFMFFIGLLSGQLNPLSSRVIDVDTKEPILRLSLDIVGSDTIDSSKNDNILLEINIISIFDELRDVTFSYFIDGKFVRQETLAVSNNNDFLRELSISDTKSGRHVAVVEVRNMEGELLGISKVSFTVAGEDVGIFRKIFNFLF
ncbi:MAG: hypothetical protein Q8Q42_02290 [Nanoarchaeota archaeon]|nr:hypothetical protein [Nanoarchaeota archaeon]